MTTGIWAPFAVAALWPPNVSCELELTKPARKHRIGAARIASVISTIETTVCTRPSGETEFSWVGPNDRGLGFEIVGVLVNIDGEPVILIIHATAPTRTPFDPAPSRARVRQARWPGHFLPAAQITLLAFRNFSDAACGVPVGYVSIGSLGRRGLLHALDRWITGSIRGRGVLHLLSPNPGLIPCESPHRPV